MRLLADVHISPRTVERLRSLGHDVVRVGDVLSATSTDDEIVAEAIRDQRVVVTQDLDFSAIVALSGRSAPSVLSLRLSSSRIENVNSSLERVLPMVEADLDAGAIVTVEDTRVRVRTLPVA